VSASVTARLVEKADKKRGMRLVDLRSFIEECETNGLPDTATIRVNVGMTEGEPSADVPTTTSRGGFVRRTWVLAGTVTEAHKACDDRDIAHVNGFPWGGRVRVLTKRSEANIRGSFVSKGDRILQLPGAAQSTVAAFEVALVAGGLTYADLEILA
jgi:hypothetical protein